MDNSVRIKELVHLVKDKYIFILCFTIGLTILTGIISNYFIKPVYQSSTQILINQQKKEENALQLNEVQTNMQIANTYKLLLKSPSVLERVIRKEKLNVSIQELDKKINVRNEKNSQIIVVTVNDTNPKTAERIADTVATEFKEGISKIMKVDNVVILPKTEMYDQSIKVSPKPIINMVIALFLGFIAAIIIVLLIEYFDDTIKNEEELEKRFDVSVLGSVSAFEQLNQDIGSNDYKIKSKTIKQRNI